jgi:hypothetical protein
VSSAVVHDLYGRLGVAPSASTEEITIAFRARAKELHPDRNPGNSSVAEQFKELTNAYNVLTRSESRAKYDRHRVAPRAASVPRQGHEPIFKTPGRARAALWAGVMLFALGVASGALLANVDTGDGPKTITLWIVVAKLVVCGGALWGAGAWRLRRMVTGLR